MRRAVLEITDSLLVEIFKGLEQGFSGKFKIIENGLPGDAKPIRCEIGCNGILRMLIESKTFEDVNDGKAKYPVLNHIVVETICEK